MDEKQTNHTISDIARELNISYGKARLMVKDEPDVLDFGSGKKKMRRIPHEVYLRILRRSANPVRPDSPVRKLA
jgi:hypothetical protein